jgi:bifunctional non-homologous end joining protein LigD
MAGKNRIPDLRPMLATLVARPVTGTGWVHEEKYDGYRALAFRRGREVALRSRNLKDITGEFPRIVAALRGLPDGDFILDGEIVAFDRKGVSRFQLLQRRGLGEGASPVLALFDCLEIGGETILRRPLSERRAALEKLLGRRARKALRLSRRLSRDGEAAYRAAARRGWEGIISKRADSPYEPGRRSPNWLKAKCRRESEFVIGGFTAPGGSRTGFGALLLGLFDARRLRYAGKVGTGFSQATIAELAGKMKPLATAASAFDPAPREKATWIKPRLVAQIAFSEWTGDGRLRQPAFLGLRFDKKATECLWSERER